MGDGDNDVTESARGGKIKGQALRPYSAIQLTLKDQAVGSPIPKRGKAPIELANKITGTVLASGKAIHEMKQRPEVVDMKQRVEEILPVVLPSERTGLTQRTGLTRPDDFSESLSTPRLAEKQQSFSDYVHQQNIRPSSSPLRRFEATANSSVRSEITSRVASPSKNQERSSSPFAYTPYEETVTDRLEKEFLPITQPRFRLNSPARRRGEPAPHRQGKNLRITSFVLAPYVGSPLR